ncbi:hypothetical protein QTP70_010266 [Hemibagrus guttatus]|uniref:Uncharacterized protein n=1 Tax=Hemibagrus guttatus TaxID=175788 RepID=A0AAE0R1R5_9TELE|nr:hypothetical protein QTP70_010266 [Hemibagrus guttatus]
MLYGLETVSLRKRQESELEVAELKMLRVLPSFQCFASGMSGPGLPAVSDAGQMESAMFFPSLRGRFGYNMSTRIKGSLANSSEKRTVITEVKPQNRCVLLLSISHAITQMDGYSPQRRLDLSYDSLGEVQELLYMYQPRKVAGNWEPIPGDLGYVFGLGEKARIPERNPYNMERTCRLPIMEV